MAATGMPMREIFAKGIDQQFSGVIMANDEKDLANEVNEYVLTDEIQANLEKFLEEYTDPANRNVNGAWISGFYGSGKSHLLKMVSHLIGTVPPDIVEDGGAGPAMGREQVVRTFMRKAADQDNHELEGLLERTGAIPATSILFNIGQVAQQSAEGAVLAAFVRMFNDARGYLGKDPAVARFERDLDANGWLEGFRQAFQQVTGQDWDTGRDAAMLWDDAIGQAYAQVTGTSVQPNLIARYEEAAGNMNVRDFTDDVAKWLDRQGRDHRIAFLVDEVGQFIGDRPELMLQLQSITEDLCARCDGRAWVVVTSQEDMDAIVGDRTKQQRYDFSKIEARFKLKLKLNSSDVIEVIQKRLLEKTDRALPVMQELWDGQNANLRTLFEFDEQGAQYSRTNRYTEADFIANYPFVDYQFLLFQNALRALSDYNMFTGKYQSVGERSMISAINSTLRTCKDERVGDLMPFDRLYDGISEALLNTSTFRITNAARMLPAEHVDLGVRILKALLMIKYVDGIAGTAHNLRVLLTDRFGQDVIGLEGRIKATLDVLERETYVTRIGETYEYLTNEENDIEQEIKDIDIDHADTVKAFREIVTGDVLKSMSIQLGAQKTPFRYGLQIDGVQQGTAKVNTWLDLVTSGSEEDRDEALLRDMGRADTLVAFLDMSDASLFDDLAMYQKTDLYLQRNAGKQQSELRGSIIAQRSATNKHLYDELRHRVARAIAGARFVYNNQPVEAKGTDAQGRVDEAMMVLLRRYYSSYLMLGDRLYPANRLAAFLMDASDTGKLEGTEGTRSGMDTPAEDVRSWILTRQQRHETVTVQAVIEHYSAAPYGWPETAVLYCLAYLYALGRVTFEIDGRDVARTEVAKRLLDRHHDAMLVEIPKIYDQGKVARLRKFATEYFPSSVVHDSTPTAPDLAKQVHAELQQHMQQLKTMRAQASAYPFASKLSSPIEHLTTVLSRGASWLLEGFTDPGSEPNSDTLLDDEADTVSLIQSFLEGKQGRQYQEGMQWIRANTANIDAASGEVRQLRDEALQLADDPEIYQSRPLVRFNTKIRQLQDAIDQALQDARREAKDTVQGVRDRIHASEEYRLAPHDAQEQADRQLESIDRAIDEQPYILGIGRLAEELMQTRRARILNGLADAVQAAARPVSTPPVDTQADGVTGQDEQDRTVPAEPVAGVKRSVTLGALPIPKDRDRLVTEDDVDEFLDAYRRTLIQAIKNGEQILL